MRFIITFSVVFSACQQVPEGDCPTGWERGYDDLCWLLEDDGPAPGETWTFGDDDDDDDNGGGDSGPIIPMDGTWSGDGVVFEVSGGGSWVSVTAADYGSCGTGGCTSSGSATCGSGCETSISSDSTEAWFDESSMGCSATFDSPTSVSGTCSDWSDCGCTMSHTFTIDF